MGLIVLPVVWRGGGGSLPTRGATADACGAVRHQSVVRAKAQIRGWREKRGKRVEGTG